MVDELLLEYFGVVLTGLAFFVAVVIGGIVALFAAGSTLFGALTIFIGFVMTFDILGLVLVLAAWWFFFHVMIVVSLILGALMIFCAAGSAVINPCR